MSQIVIADRQKVLLDTGLNEYAFGKTGFADEMQEEGFIAIPDNSGEYRFEKWKFSGTVTGENGHVFFSGTGFDGKTLAFLYEEDSGYSAAASFAACRVLTQVIHDMISSCLPGAGGILVPDTPEEKNITLLFLPPKLFENAALNAGKKSYAELQGFWYYKSRSDTETLTFLCAAIAYRALSGSVPYTSEDNDNRQADIYDGLFMPVEYRINGIKQELAAAIDAGLDPVKKRKADTGRTDFPLSMLQKALKLGNTRNGTLPPDGSEPIPQEQFEQQSRLLYKKQQQRTAFKRNIRKHSTLLAASAIAIIILIISGINFHNAQGERPVSTGLTSEETVLSFYAGMNVQNTDLMQAMSSGKAANNYINSISGIFVTGKMRQAYESIAAPVTPSLWFFAKDKTRQPVYGLTRFMLDSREKLPVSSAHLLKEHVSPVTQENGTLLKNGDTATHTVSYNVLLSTGSGMAVRSCTDTLSLTYKKKRWIITDIRGETTEVTFDYQTFLKDMEAERKAAGENIPAAVTVLRSKYPWVPTDTDMIEAQKSQSRQPR